jgi:hypothetical protein
MSHDVDAPGERLDRRDYVLEIEDTFSGRLRQAA